MKTVVLTVVSVLALHSIAEVTTQASTWDPDQCYKSGDFNCGDVCVDVVHRYRCYCGGEEWKGFDDREDKRYCCVPPGGNQCSKVKYKDQLGNEQFNVNCSSGVLQPWYKPCHDDNCAASPEVIEKNNCQYDCLARTDEVSVKQNDATIDQYGDLQNCNASYGTPGLNGTITNGDCKPNHKWCTENISCESEVSRDRLQLQRFCQNPTFWSSQDCNNYNSDGTVYSYGERCTGNQQHCFYPAYRSYDYETFRDIDGFLTQCKDKSDQIFEKHSHCNMRSTLDIYCDHCRDNNNTWLWGDEDYGDCQTKCDNREQFIEEQTDPNKTWPSGRGSTRNDVLDPHNCQASCLQPGYYGCTACENKEYFNCSSSSKCLHPDLVCDGVPQCPPVPPSTEPQDEELERCREKGVFRSDAIMKCQSKFHPNVTILAVPCNDVIECDNDADESWICRNTTTIVSFGVGGIFVAIISVFVRFKIQSLKRKEIKIQFRKLLIFNIKEFHENEKLRSFGFFPFLAVNSVAKQNEILENISKEEEKINNSNEFQKMLWIKNAYSKFEISVMAEYIYPSFLLVIHPIKFVLKTLLKLKQSNQIIWWLWNMVKKISFAYIDLTKDISITTTLLFMIGIDTLIVFPTAFPSVVVMCLIVSIVLPLLLSSLQLAKDHPDIIYGENFFKQSRWRQVLGRIGIVLMAFINPALFIHAHESNQEQLKFQDLKDKKYEEIEKIRKKGEVIQRQYVTYIRTELGFEAIFQIALQIILLLQARTSSSTVSGLETVFGKSNSIGIDTDTLIILSILWSTKTCVTLHLKAAEIEKTHLRVWSKIGLVLISLFCSCARLLSIIAFFTPFIGLFDLLNHHKTEQIPFAQNIRDDFKGNITWRKIDRWTFKNETEPGTPPGYDRYTLFTLAESVQLFAILFFLQFLIVYMVKVMKAEKFGEADNLKKFLHVMENMNIPYPVEDFDVLNGTEREHRERFEKVNTEVLMTMVVNMLIHLLMLGPLWYTASQVISRHELLEMTIGVRDDEVDSYNVAQYLPSLLTTSVLVTSLLGVASFLLYNYKLHPWSILVCHPDDQTTSPEENKNTEYADISIPVPYDPKIPGVRCVDAEDIGQGEFLDPFLIIEEKPPAERTCRLKISRMLFE